jgi:hypothetical protein
VPTLASDLRSSRGLDRLVGGGVDCGGLRHGAPRVANLSAASLRWVEQGLVNKTEITVDFLQCFE